MQSVECEEKMTRGGEEEMERGLKKDVRRRDADEDVCLSRRERETGPL